jgi:hypothetical protein
MYLTRFHKAILNKIWENQKKYIKTKKDFDLNEFIEFYSKWYEKKYQKQIYSKADDAITDCVYAGYKLSSKNQYLIKNKYKRDVILALRELSTLLKFLDSNNLINIIEKNSGSQLKEKFPECIPLVIEKNEDEKYKPFMEGLKIITEYLGKDIQVRVGYKKFKRYNYQTHDELLRFIIGVWLPIIGALITILTKIINLKCH